jgi:hypothetical protein
VAWAFAAVLVGALLTALTPAGANAEAAAPAPGATGRVAFIGVPALMWRDVTPKSMPNLWRLAEHGSTGSLSVKAVGPRACPADGWLTVSAGVRSAYPGMPCVYEPPHPTPDAHGGATIPYFNQVAAHNDGGDFEATIGTLAHSEQAAGKCVTAIGPGAALGATDPKGYVQHYVPGIDAARGADWSRCATTLVDVDDVFQAHRQAAGSDGEPTEIPAAARAAASARADARIGQTLAALPKGTSVVVAGISDHDRVPHLRVAVAADAAGVAAAAGHGAAGASGAGGTLTSGSVRRSGMVILPDITATLLRASGVAVPGQVIGASWEQSGTATPQRALADDDIAAQTVRDLLPWFFAILVIVQLLFYAGAAAALRWGSAKRRRRTLTAVRIAALASAAIPLSTYLVNLVPWWTAGHPLAALLVALPVADALVVGIAMAGPWRRALLGPFTVVAVGTAGILALDVMTGSNLQLNSLMGYTALVGGRYYGFGNIAFSVFVTSVILAGVGLAQWVAARRGGTRGRAWAAITVLALGVVGLTLDGAPFLGADFGGVIALVPGLALTAMTVAGVRVSLVRLGALCVAGGVLVMGIATLDYLRPPDAQTHLGRFVGQLLAGDAVPVVMRKFSAMVHTFGNMTLTPIMLAALVFLFFVLRRPDRARAGALDSAFARAPMLRAGLIGALTTATVGTFVNDSGVAVIALALTLAVPLTLTTAIRALELDDAAPRPVEPVPAPT